MKKKKTVFEKLKEHQKPANQLAAKVAFFKGEHFDPVVPENRKIYTMDTPLRRRELPLGFKDYTGLRHGNMTALFFFKQKNPEKIRSKSIWVCRCDCGKYEFRQPCKWLREKNKDKPDKCGACLLKDDARKGVINPSSFIERTLGSSKKTMPERLIKWIKAMQDMGLSDDEITDIRRLEVIHTHGKTADQIRMEISDLKSRDCLTGSRHG